MLLITIIVLLDEKKKKIGRSIKNIYEYELTFYNFLLWKMTMKYDTDIYNIVIFWISLL